MKQKIVIELESSEEIHAQDIIDILDSFSIVTVETETEFLIFENTNQV